MLAVEVKKVLQDRSCSKINSRLFNILCPKTKTLRSGFKNDGVWNETKTKLQLCKKIKLLLFFHKRRLVKSINLKIRLK